QGRTADAAGAAAIAYVARDRSPGDERPTVRAGRGGAVPDHRRARARRCVPAMAVGGSRGRPRRALLAGDRDRRGAGLLRADAVLHGALVPGVVGTADAAHQPAAGARPDRAAPDLATHAGRGRRTGR